MDGHNLDIEIREWVIRPIITFKEGVFRDIVPTFSNLDARANRKADEYYERMGDQPASDDFDGDLSIYAEEAHGQAFSWYQMMRSLRQTMLNLIAAGLFHLTEQQLAVLCRAAGFTAEPPKDTKLEIVAKWYHANLRLELEGLPSWPIIEELRFVANAVKHAEGSSAGRLRSLRPELFTDPTFADLEGLYEKGTFRTTTLAAPLAGEDLFVSEELLMKYAEAAESFFREIAAHFEAHGSEYY
jgi:hypothetical protein